MHGSYYIKNLMLQKQTPVENNFTKVFKILVQQLFFRYKRLDKNFHKKHFMICHNFGIWKTVFRAIFDLSNKIALLILRRMYALYVKKSNLVKTKIEIVSKEWYFWINSTLLDSAWLSLAQLSLAQHSHRINISLKV